MSVRVVINELPPAAGPDDYRIHCDALEWSLAEPIIINSADDIKSRADWKDRLDPYYHQVQNLMRFCRRLPVTLLADDVGLGKTISAGLIVSELMKRSRISKVLVICPKILIPQWVEELESKFGIEAYGATGGELRSSVRRAEPVIATTYQSATKLLQKQEAGLFDMLILDEAHKVRNLHGTASPPKMASAIYGALQARMFKYVLMLTATPIQNRLWDIYSLVDCLAVAKGHKNPFGSPDRFADRYLADGKGKARQLNAKTADEFRSIVSSYMFRTRRVDAKLAFPDRKVKPYPVTPTQDELRLQDLIAANIHRFNPLLQTSLLVALMSSPHALAAQLKNMADKKEGYRGLANDVERIVDNSQTPAKISVVLRIAADLREQRPDWRIVIFTTRKETQKMIARYLEQSGIQSGFIVGGAATQNKRSIDAFRKDPPDINVIISTDAGAEGVNLQAANVLVNYDLPWNPMIVEQRIGRVQRIGSKFKSVWVANVVHEDSPEQRIVARLMEKLQVISHTVGDIEAVLDVAGDSNGDSFEKQIRDMVIASLRGQDVAAAARKAEESIEDAKKLFEEQQIEMDKKLGAMDDEESADVPMPRLKKGEPATPLQDFVLGALRAEGASIEPPENGVYRATSARLEEERFTFDEAVWEEHSRGGVFMGRAPLLYQPGKPAFERLVQRWIDRSAAKIEDRRSDNSEFDNRASKWLGTVPEARMIGVKLADRINKFTGSVVCRTRVSNAVDSYERLVNVKCVSNGASISSKLEVDRPVNAKLLSPRMEQEITKTVDADRDLGQFRQYYEARLESELAKTEKGSRRDKLINDLRPNVTAEASAVEGRFTDTVTLAIKYDFEDSPVYESEVQFNGIKVIDEPPRETCQISGLKLPANCLAKCEVSRATALRHLLQKSEHSGRLALPSNVAACEESGKVALVTELATCCLTSKRVLRGKLVESAVSGRWALASQATKCEITGATILVDEVATSGHSQRRFRSDESVKVHPSGMIVHQSEAAQCGYSQRWCLSDDCVPSEVTGKLVFKDDVRRSEKSGRECHRSEVVVCAQSGVQLLPDESKRCAITNQLVDKDLLILCPESGKRGLQSHFEKCEVTGELVAPEALGQCSVTHVRVRRSLLQPSKVSGQLALPEKLVKCEVSGIEMLPDEAFRCTLTRKLVDARLLKACSQSGTLALASEMFQSAASGKWMLRRYAVKCIDGNLAGRNEASLCNWERGYRKNTEIATCSLSGLTFTKSYLNPSSEFVTLRQCLDGELKGSPFPDPGFLARLLPDIFGKVKSFHWRSASHGQTHILFGRKSTLGVMHSWFAVLGHGDLNGLQLKGKVLFGKRARGIWTLTDSYDL